jgi:hypothetical protein
MSNPAKAISSKDGKRFLQDAFHEQQKVLQAHLEYAKKTITHDGKCGDVTEKHFLKTLAAYLPNRYAVDSAIVIDCKGQTSDQMDVVIYDPQYTPCLLDQHDHKYIPAEAVYAVLEVKPEINAKYLVYAGKKAESVRRLHRTSIPIPHAGSVPYPAKVLFPITAGLIAADVSWKDGFGNSFKKQLSALKGERRLDCVVAVSTSSFDVFEAAPRVVGGRNALVFFLFRLLQKLQSLGTVPAIDWNAYASQLANVNLNPK